MAVFAFTSCGVLLDDDNWTAQTSELDTNGTVQMREVPNMGGGGYRHSIPGITEFTSMFKGWADYSSGTTSIGAKITQADLGQQKILSLTPTVNIENASVGDPAFTMRGIMSAFKMPTGAIGDAAGFQLDLTSDTAAVTGGYVGAPLASRTTAGYTGTGVNIAGPSATQRLYAALHVTAAAGTNLAVKVQSDDNSGFTTPTDRITFSTVSAVGSQFSSVAGNLATETWWRVTATIATSTFSFAVVFGIA